MNQVSEFCYVCFECSKNLKDLLKSQDECMELIAKLRVCVSEVNWSSNKKLLLCEKCIRKLNKAHEFKKQCIQSSETLKLYLSELERKEKQKKEESPLVLQYLNLMKDDKSTKKIPPPPPPLAQQPLKTDQKIYPAITKIILTNQPNTFQNVFLNLLPQNLVSKTSAKPHYYQLSPQKESKKTKPKEEDVSKMLKGSKMEEVSVEIDPLDFDMMDQTDIKAETVKQPPTLGNNIFRPILPKSEDYDYTNEEKMEFFNSGHFLLQDFDKSNRHFCDKCLVRFESTKALHIHIKEVHSSKYPYMCEYCGMEFAAKEVYRVHMHRHSSDSSDLLNNSITLTDFTNNSPKIIDLLTPKVAVQEDCGERLKEKEVVEEKKELKETVVAEEVKCDECDRSFVSEQGLIRHKSKIHKSYKRKKYFIKGMKNAQCDICNRMFSTQSYMNLHKKLHERKGEWGRKIYKREEVVVGNPMDGDDFHSDIEMVEDDEEDMEKLRLTNTTQSFLKQTLMQSPVATKIAGTNDNGKNDTELKCVFCGKVFIRYQGLLRHLNTAHSK